MLSHKKVDGGTITPGTGATNLGKAEDSAAASGDTGVAMLAVRNDSNVSKTDANGDYSGLAVDAAGALQTPKASSANTPAIASSATALAANAARKQWSIQNLGTNPLFVRLGASASTTVFHFVLKAGTGANDGLGGVIVDSTWLGVVSIDGTTPSYCVSELTF